MIKVCYQSVDSYGRITTRTFKTLAGARAYAVRMVGKHPEFGSHYAVSRDGIGKITVAEGCTLVDLFQGMAQEEASALSRRTVSGRA